MSEVKQEVVKKEPVIAEISIKASFNYDEIIEVMESLRKGIDSFDVLVIYLNSMGGQINTGLVFRDFLNASGKKIVYVSELLNCSLATALPQCGEGLRLAYPTSRFMIHDSTYSFKGCREEIANQMEYTSHADKIWDETYINAMGLTKKEYTKLVSFDRVLYGDQFMELGTLGGLDGLILKRLSVGEYVCKTRTGIKLLNLRYHNRHDVAELPEYKEPV